MRRRLFIIAAILLSTWTVAYADSLPAGSYANSCDKCSVNAKEDSLSCTCKKADGATTPTLLRDLSKCKKEINNCNGALTCGSC
jgi:hypothetical protein